MTSRFLLVSTFLATVTLCRAQTPPGSDAKSAAKEIVVPVTVTDDKGHLISNLEQKDFQIFEDDKPQQIRAFSREHNQPIVIGFLVDTSSSSRNHWDSFQSAATQLVQNLLANSNYAAYLVDYSQDAEVSVNTTSDPDALLNKIAKLKPGGGAALYDAIFLACTSRKFLKGEPVEPRRILIIIGDGHDDASSHSLGQALQLAHRNLVTIYCIGTQAFGLAKEGDTTLQKLAVETGGRVVYPLNGPSEELEGKLAQSVADIVSEINNQYLLFFVSDNATEKAYRNLRVTVNLQNVKVRARKGY